MRLIDADVLHEHEFKTPKYKQIGGRRNGKTIENINLAYQKGWNDAISAIIDNAPTVDTTFRELVAYECGQIEKMLLRFIKAVIDFRGDEA